MRSSEQELRSLRSSIPGWMSPEAGHLRPCMRSPSHSTSVVLPSTKTLRWLSSCRAMLLVYRRCGPIGTLKPRLIFLFSVRGERNINNSSDVQLLRQVTHIISRSTHSDQYLDDGDDFLALFTPDMNVSTLPIWLEAIRGRVSVVDILTKAHTLKPGFLRNPGKGGRPEVLQDWRNIDHQGYCLMSEVEGVPLTKRRNFYSPGRKIYTNFCIRGVGRRRSSSKFISSKWMHS